MGIIYQREKEIEKFMSEPYWDCEGTFTFDDHKVTGKWFNEDGEHIFIKEASEVLVEHCKDGPVQVYSVNREEKKVRPPQFYNKRNP